MANDMQQRVMALLAKAGDPAATEAEARACLTKAHKLMEKHGFTEDDLHKVQEDDFVWQTWEAKMSPKHGAIFHPVDRLCGSTIAKFCGCRLFFTRDPGYGVVAAKFFGLKNDVALAEWLRAALIEQFDAGWSDYVYIERKNKSVRSVPAARKAYAAGFSRAICDRLEDWLYRSAPDLDGFDNAIVFKKQDVIQDELDRLGYTISTNIYSGPKVTDGLAAGAGFNAGKAARLGTGLYGGRPQLLVTDRR